jgi:hypothetical protein
MTVERVIRITRRAFFDNALRARPRENWTNLRMCMDMFNVSPLPPRVKLANTCQFFFTFFKGRKKEKKRENKKKFPLQKDKSSF